MSKEPAPSRPHVPGYGIPKSVEGVLSWSHVCERLVQSRNYWVATVDSDEQPHAVPVWGVWVDDALCFGGGPDTRWSRNLAANPKVAVHLEDGNDVVILEGSVERITDPDHPLASRIDDAYEPKYNMRHGTPFWLLRPRVVFAWTGFPKDATRWILGD
ncbi:MAG: pyridoxamine 5'-phosphate oxidase family protein [Anaerolineae bacterium]|nr:pyridoxamine 5'-phosphate oxidase family protein [Anaerolineae bacterium]